MEGVAELTLSSTCTGITNLNHNIEDRQAAANEFSGKLACVIQGFRSVNMSQRAMVAELNKLGIIITRKGE